MTLPALRIILADLAKCIPETILPSSTCEVEIEEIDPVAGVAEGM